MALPIAFVWGFIFAVMAFIIFLLVVKRKVKGGTKIYENVIYPEENSTGRTDGHTTSESESGTDGDVGGNPTTLSHPRIVLRPKQNESLYSGQNEHPGTEPRRIKINLKGKLPDNGEDSENT